MATQTNINSIKDIRNTLDEALPFVFGQMGYTQSFTMGDVKLAIGYSIAVVAGITFVLDKKMKFQDSLPYLQVLLLAYGVLSAAFSYYIKFIEKNTKYIGYKKGEKVAVVATMENYTPVYNVEVNGVKGSLNVEKVFDQFGFLQQEVLNQWFKDLLEKKEN